MKPHLNTLQQIVILYFDLSLATDSLALPPWLFPKMAPFEFISMMHRLYPGFMNGWRCIANSLLRTASSTELPFENIQKKLYATGDKIVRITRRINAIIRQKESVRGTGDADKESRVESILRRVKSKVSCSSSSQREISQLHKQLELFRTTLAFSRPSFLERYMWIGYLFVYLIVWYVFQRYILLAPEL